MRAIIRTLFIALAVLALAPPAGAQSGLLDSAKKLLGVGGDGATTGGGLSTETIANGLKEALKVGTQTVVAQLGQADGFLADPEIHIPLPDSLQKVDKALAMVGRSSLTQELEEKINRAAEAATPLVKDLLWQSIDQMTFDDVQQIYEGPDDAATQYFRRTMSDPLREAMRPIVDDTLAEVGAVAVYQRTMERYDAIPFAPKVDANLTDYTLDKGLDGLFHYIAIEEAAIRQNPVKRTTELLQRVFGG